MSKEINLKQTTISLDEAVRDTAKRQAKKGRNSLSSYIEMLITADFKKRGICAISDAELKDMQRVASSRGIGSSL